MRFVISSKLLDPSGEEILSEHGKPSVSKGVDNRISDEVEGHRVHAHTIHPLWNVRHTHRGQGKYHHSRDVAGNEDPADEGDSPDCLGVVVVVVVVGGGEDEAEDEDITDDGDEGRQSQVEPGYEPHDAKVGGNYCHVLPVETTAVQVRRGVLDDGLYACYTRHTDQVKHPHTHQHPLQKISI